MDFLFRQAQQSKLKSYSTLGLFGIEDLFLKHLSFGSDKGVITKKRHYHKHFEIHIIEKGYQIYEFEGDRLRVEAGSLLFIPPFVKHTAANEDPSTVKYALSFSLTSESNLADAIGGCVHATLRTPDTVLESLEFITSEKRKKAPYSRALIENRILECIIHIFRCLGLRDALTEEEGEMEDDPRIQLVKQYVKDNIAENINTEELASYCRISEKHLERIFLQSEGKTLMTFVREQKCREIEKLLADSSLSIKQISEMMNFSNEYYFNAFFKKHSGMPPGAYRKTVLK